MLTHSVARKNMDDVSVNSTRKLSYHGAAPVAFWRRALTLFGGFTVYMQLGCMYTIASVVPYASSYMRYMGQKEVRHADLGWLFTSSLASMCLSMFHGIRLHRALGVAYCAFLGCVLMGCSFILASYSCHRIVLLCCTCGVGMGLALGVASVCPLTAAYRAWPNHRGIAAAIVLSGINASPILFSAIEVWVLNPAGVVASDVPYPEHPYERYFSDPSVLMRVPHMFNILGCSCLVLAIAALLLDLPYGRGSGPQCSGTALSAHTTRGFSDPVKLMHWCSSHTGPACLEGRNEGSACRLPDESNAAPTVACRLEGHIRQGEGACGYAAILSIWVVYVFLGLSVHFVAFVWNAIDLSLRDPSAGALSAHSEESVLAQARKHLLPGKMQLCTEVGGPPTSSHQHHIAVFGDRGLTDFGGAVIAVATLVGRVGWGIFTDACGGSIAVRSLCCCVAALLGCFAAALYGSLHFFMVWLFLVYTCVGGIFVTLPLVIAEVAPPSAFSWLFTLVHTSRPASTALSSVLISLCYPSMGLTGCSALVALAAAAALVVSPRYTRRLAEEPGGLWAYDDFDVESRILWPVSTLSPTKSRLRC